MERERRKEKEKSKMMNKSMGNKYRRTIEKETRKRDRILDADDERR